MVENSDVLSCRAVCPFGKGDFKPCKDAFMDDRKICLTNIETNIKRITSSEVKDLVFSFSKNLVTATSEEKGIEARIFNGLITNRS